MPENAQPHFHDPRLNLRGIGMAPTWKRPDVYYPDRPYFSSQEGFHSLVALKRSGGVQLRKPTTGNPGHLYRLHSAFGRAILDQARINEYLCLFEIARDIRLNNNVAELDIPPDATIDCGGKNRERAAGDKESVPPARDIRERNGPVVPRHCCDGACRLALIQRDKAQNNATKRPSPGAGSAAKNLRGLNRLVNSPLRSGGCVQGSQEERKGLPKRPGGHQALC